MFAMVIVVSFVIANSFEKTVYIHADAPFDTLVDCYQQQSIEEARIWKQVEAGKVRLPPSTLDESAEAITSTKVVAHCYKRIIA